MPLKTKVPPSSEGAQQSASQPRTVSAERYLPINPELNERINRLIKARPAVYEYYATLVREHPERAIRGFILNRMFREEAMKRQTMRQLPQAKEWLDKQVQSLKHIIDRINRINPFCNEKVKQVPQGKARIDFAPPRQGPRIST